MTFPSKTYRLGFRVSGIDLFLVQPGRLDFSLDYSMQSNIVRACVHHLIQSERLRYLA